MKRTAVTAAFLVALTSTPVLAQTPDFGNDSSPYANDGECDDPRFIGWGVATSTSHETVGKDASDCARLFNLRQIRLNRTQAESSIEQCQSIDFGDNSSEWSNDGECDDPRFWGGAMHTILNFGDLGRDAKDCRALCNSGAIWLR